MFRLLRAMSIAAVVAACFLEQFARPSAQPRRAPVLDVPPGDTGRRVTENGLVANYFPARQRAPALVTLTGSVGGLTMNDVAIALQAEGFTVLHLSYYRGPGQNQNAELIPLEYFSTALGWLQRQPEVDPAKVGIVGVSKGAEAALVVAVRHPELKAIVAALPSSVVWPGIIWEPRTGPIGSSWSEQGKPLPHLPHVPYDASKGGTMADNYAASLKAVASHPESLIAVERIAAPVLLVCGEADQIWPSCPMARQIQNRLTARDRPAATLLAYDDAGHLAFGLPLPPDDPRVTSSGGTDRGNRTARADSWNKAVAFLKANLQN
jgi:dienelactone hydrolase